MRNIPCNTAWTRRQKRWPYWDAGSAPQQVNLPDDFVLEKPRTPTAPGEAAVGFIPDGLATYEKTFDAPKEWEGKPVFLSFDGAYMNARVTVNRELLQLHPYGYTPFAVELTPWLRFDIPNQLEVTLQGTQPSSRWYSGAGLYRQVSFWVGEPCYIDPRDLFLTTPVVERDSAQVLVEAQAQNTTSQPQEALLEVTLSFQGQEKARASVPVTLAPGEKTPCSLTLTVDAPALWDDLEPNLYQATVSLSAPGQEPDTTTQNIGIRKIEVTAAEGMKVNGRKVKLYGGCIHHDNGILGAAALPRAEFRKIQKLREGGYNAIRTAHNPPSQALLDACDQLGVYVIDEFFDCWRIGKNRNDYHLWFEDWWQRDIESTIRRDRNHPCVYCWSFGNEIPEANGAANAEYWMQAQADFIRSLDSTRLVTCGGMFMPECLKANPEPSGPPTKPDPYCSDEEHARRFKAMISHLDIVSLNYSFRHYEQFHKLFPDMPLQGTETMGSETWGNWDAIRDNDYVIGDFMWTAIDNLGEAGAGRFFYDPNEMGPSLMGGWPWLSCYQGDLALDAERLPRSYYRKVIWGMDDGIYAFTTPPAYTGKPLYGTGWHWHNVLPSWTYGEEYVGKPIQVEAYCDCDEVEFFVNGESQGKAAPVEMIATLTVTYQPGQLKAVAYRQGKPVGESVLETTGPAVALRLEADRQSLSADTLDLCYVTATLVDGQGRRVYNDDRELSAFLRGPGTLAGFGSNNPCTEESYGTGRRFTWHGHAMLVLRAGDAPGQLELTVSTQGLETQMLQIPTV